MSDYRATEPCKFLLEFESLPGFPKNPRPEKYRWNSEARIAKFREHLDTTTAAAARESAETGHPVSGSFCRTLSAILALADSPYQPEPIEEPAPPADPVDELDTPPAREEEIR